MKCGTEEACRTGSSWNSVAYWRRYLDRRLDLVMRFCLEKYKFLLSIYFKYLFAKKQLVICAWLSGLCCLSILFGAAIAFSPDNQYQHFTNELYCQWLFDKPIDYARLAEKMERDMEDKLISSVYVLAKAPSKNGDVLVYGLSRNVFMTPNNILYGTADANNKELGCYVEHCFIPDEYDVNMEDMHVTINGRRMNRVEKAFMLPYTFPSEIISQIESDETIAIDCAQNPNMRVFGRASESDNAVGAIYIPLDMMADQHICVAAMAIVMNEPLTEAERVKLETSYKEFGVRPFSHPVLSNWSELTHEMLGEKVKEMWAVEMIMFACMVNQLIFWKLFMQRLKPVIKRCTMLGASIREVRVSLTLFLAILALMMLIMVVPIYALCMGGTNLRPGLSIASIASVGIVWVIGFVGYCLINGMNRKRKGC